MKWIITIREGFVRDAQSPIETQNLSEDELYDLDDNYWADNSCPSFLDFVDGETAEEAIHQFVQTNGYDERILEAIPIPRQNTKKVWTHDEASRILEAFENVLSEYNIHIPSPEDDDREEDNMIGLYGSTYSDLLDRVEDILINLLKDSELTVVPYEYSGTY